MHLFLDIDGVLNCERDWRVPYSINSNCLNVFAKLIKELEKRERVEVVLISTWRAGLGDGKGNLNPVDKLMKELKILGIMVEGCTPMSDKGRQAEVEFYIRRNKIRNYIILDDDSSLYSDIDAVRLYVVDHKTGLQEADIKKITKCFRKQVCLNSVFKRFWH